jgi:hypothetical protein
MGGDMRDGTITQDDKLKLNKLRQKVFKAWGGSDFQRLYEESPALRRIGFGVFGLYYYDISHDLYDQAVADCKAMLDAAKKGGA